MIREIGELNTRVTFYEFAPSDGPEAGESEIRNLYSCWAAAEKVWMRDVEQAKANGTLEDVTLVIRDPRGDFIPSNHHYVGIDDGRFFGKRYNVKTIQPDMTDKRFMLVIAGLIS